MTRFDTRLVLPDEDEDLPHSRPVWRSALLELGLLAAVALGLLLFAGGTVLDETRRIGVSAGLALLPLALWWAFSWRGERRVQEPRRLLMPVLLLSMLVANAITAPVLEGIIEPGRWLNASPLLTRIVGTLLTVGLVTEGSKLLVLWLLAWPGAFVRRVDAVALSLTTGLGFATVFSLRYALIQGGGQPAAAAIHILGLTLAQQAIAIVIGAGLVALQRRRGSVFILPAYLLGGALLHGLHTVIRTGMVVRGFGIGAVANSPLLGLVFAVVFALVVYAAAGFLFSNADAREEQLGLQPAPVRPVQDGEERAG